MARIRYVRTFFETKDEGQPGISKQEISTVPYPELSDRKYTLTLRFKLSNGRFVCGHEKAAPNFYIDAAPSGMYFHYTYRGKGSYNGQEFRAGDIFVTRPYSQKVIQADANDPYENFWCLWKGELAKIMANKMTRYEDDHFYRLDESFCLHDLFRYMIYNYHRESKIDRVVNSFSELLLADCHLVSRDLPAQKEKHTAIIDEIKSYIEQNFRTTSVEEIAQLFHYNRRYLSSVFHEQTGSTIQDLIQDTKLRHAEACLLEKQLSVEKIAFSAGYASYSAFIKAFKKKYDMTPSEFIRFYTEL